jgi:hypothetical protein
MPSMIGKLHNSIAVSTALLLIFCGNAVAVSTPGSIEGTVVDKDTGLPIAYCNVILVGTKIGAMTKLHGSFRIVGIPPGPYMIKAMIMGYKSASQCRVDVKEGETLNISFELERLSRDEIAELGRSVTVGGYGCTLHKEGEFLRAEWIKLPVVDRPIYYGEAYAKVRANLFPKGDFYILDEFLSQSTDSAWTWRCPQCVQQKILWFSR